MRYLTRMVSDQIKHFLHRAAFGLSLPTNLGGFDAADWINKSIDNRPIKIVEKTQITSETMRVGKNAKQSLTKSRDNLMALNTAWIHQLTEPSIVFREKMTLFWHDHFACRARFPYLAQQQNNILRQHALGNFTNLLSAIAKDPAMLQFLNNQQNKKDSPNENFARELLELFTFGSGHYTEDDIKNSARAFTGWSFSPFSGKFFFREKVHDHGLKTFKGKSGKYSGDDILNIILEDKQTARFLTEKIWRYFVCDSEVDTEIIDPMAAKLYQSDYNIKKLLTEIFSSPSFYNPQVIGNRVKSPVELIAGIVAQTGGSFENPHAVLFIQRALSQVLFLPPNVGGWPAGTEWIDSSSLTFRMSLPAVLLEGSQTDIEAKDDGDANNTINLANSKKLTLTVDWDMLSNQFGKSNADETLASVEDYLLVRPASEANNKIVRAYTGKSKSDSEFIKKAFVGYMSLPEYQLS